ncbi:BgTH12-06432 [Blumeria graminis f. sp. triticale]|uniref:BgTH12-06432 n=1 Tax=Blumeria graminis f. sp. triticale TaxID=1689686 RepID=A0A9W4CXM3_BLUGR|nr:BgTH12-06432 [Blumeria graminis f. sp. triticale]
MTTIKPVEDLTLTPLKLWVFFSLGKYRENSSHRTSKV